MSVYKVIDPNGVTYEPSGPGSTKRLPQGELLILEDKLDYLIGTQIGPRQVQRINPAALQDAVNHINSGGSSFYQGSRMRPRWEEAPPPTSIDVDDENPDPSIAALERSASDGAPAPGASGGMPVTEPPPPPADQQAEGPRRPGRQPKQQQ